MELTADSSLSIIGSLSTTTAKAAKMSLKKWIRVVLNFIVLIPTFLICQILAIFSGVEFERSVSKFKKKKKKKNRCLVFTSAIKREIKNFHVVVVQWRQRNKQKAVGGRSDYPDGQLCRGLTKERIVKGSSCGAGVWRRMGIKVLAWGNCAPSRARYVLASVSTPPPFPFPQTPGKHAIHRVTGSVWQTLRGGRVPTNHLITRLRKHPFFLAHHR